MPSPRRTDFARHIREEDSFWSFIFNKHQEDSKRLTALNRIVCCFEDHGPLTYNQLREVYWRKYRNQLDMSSLNTSTVGLNYIFCTNEKDPLAVFRAAWLLFHVETDSFISYIGDKDLQKCDVPWKDAFASAKTIWERDQYYIITYFDRIFAAVKATKNVQRMTIQEVIRQVRSGLKDDFRCHPITNPDPKFFLGYIKKFFTESFEIVFDDSVGKVFISQAKDASQKWPSRKGLEIFESLKIPPTYPNYVDETRNKNKMLDVCLKPTYVPADGIFVRFEDEESKQRRDFVESSLHNIVDLSMSDPSNNLSKCIIVAENWPCLVKLQNTLLRGVIVGRSMSLNEVPLVLVECVDTGDIIFVEMEQLYECPKFLLGVPKCGAFIVLADNGLPWPMSHPTEKENWIKLLPKLKRNQAIMRVLFMDPAVRTDYSGLQKSVVHKAKLSVEFSEESGEDLLHVNYPDAWIKKEKVYHAK